MRWHELNEDYSRPIGLAKTAYSNLSSGAKQALDQWEAANWIDGPLERHFKNNDEIAQEIEAVFAPIRATLPAQILLYRGVTNEKWDSYQRKILESWTSDKRVAEVFAGFHRIGEKMPVSATEAEIDKAVAQYERSGFVKFRGKYYVRNKEAPRYYDIYDRSKQYLTDGDDIRGDFNSDKYWTDEINTERLSKGKVIEEMISRDRIVWLTNNLGCKEYLVRI